MSIHRKWSKKAMVDDIDNAIDVVSNAGVFICHWSKSKERLLHGAFHLVAVIVCMD